MSDNNSAVDPVFKTIPKDSTCFMIWRIEKLKLVPVPKDQYGVFYEGDSYIVLCAVPPGCKDPLGAGMQVKEVRGALDIRVHMWQGKETSRDEAGVSAYKAVELDDYLGGSPVQYRETQDHESKIFLGYFKSKGGIKYLSGGVASGFNHVEQVIKIRLFHVKGKSTPRIREIPIKWSNMNDGDAYILDVGTAQYVWCGKSCSFAERKKAMEFARSQRNSRGKGDLIVVEDGEESESGMGGEEFQVFDEYLPVSEKSSMKSAAEGGADDAFEFKAAEAIKLFRCTDEGGQFRCEEVGAKPLTKSMLDPNDVFIIDNGEAGIWCWIGKKATKQERKSGMEKANSFIDSRGYHKDTPVTRVIDQGEPPEFRALFKVWEKPKLPGTTKTYSTNRIAQTVQTKFDAMTMHENPKAAAQANMPDDGSGTKKIYRIEKQGTTYEMVEQDKRYSGQLYGGDCYIIHYVYLVNGKENHIIYYWIGKKCTQDEQTAVAFKTVELDDSIGKIGVQVRVVHGKEPKHFMAMFGGKLIIFSGGKAGWAGHDEGPGDKYLLHVRGTSEMNSKAEQVDCRAASLNSNDCFVLVSKTAVFMWVGKGATGDEREMAKKVASISPRGYQLVSEGQEKKEFWELLGGQEPYANDPRLIVDEEERDPRLFQCSNASGVFKVEEITDFVQQDLNPDDVFILDTFDVVWVWVGEGCRADEELWSEKAAMDYVEKDPAGRDQDTPINKIRQGYEPPNFTGFFGIWDRDLWSKGKTFEELRAEMKENNLGMESVIARQDSGSASYSEVAKFSYADLCKPNDELPAGVDPGYKEKHLSAQEFQAVFGMTYEDYNMKPNWKQVQLKKEHKLF